MRTPGPRASLAPFVGVALAALTIGSLVTFSLVAQRTSLEGFTRPGVVVAASPTASPPSIVLPGTSAPSPRADAGPAGATEAPPATELLVASPADAQPPVTGVLGPPESSGDLLPSRDGSSLELPGGPVSASLSDGDAGSTDQDEGKAKKAKKAKSPTARTAAAPSQARGRPDHARPPSKPKPARRSPQQKPTPVAKGHEKARGQGHAKDRGRGHHKH